MNHSNLRNGNFNEKRRSFFKYTLMAIASTAFFSYFRGKSTLAFAETSLPLLKESDPTAKALGYYANANKVDTKKWPKKAGPDGGIQKCSNCMFYTGTDKKSGKCQIFPNNLVAAGGWCNSWIKKA